MTKFISIDVESAGPTPKYNLLSIGACDVDNINNSFYIELNFMNIDKVVPEAIAVGGFTTESVLANGTNPYKAMGMFASWLKQFDHPKMVGFNAPFDWQFINYYFHHFYGTNPLGINALDIKALYMGVSRCEWGRAVKSRMPRMTERKHTHNALDDAQEQADIFNAVMRMVKMLTFEKKQPGPSYDVFDEYDAQIGRINENLTFYF